MIQRKTETYLSKFCTRTKRKTNIRDQRYKSREEEVECFSTQKFIFPLTDSFSIQTLGNSLIEKFVSQNSSATLGCRGRSQPSYHDQGLSNCFKSMYKMHPNKPPTFYELS